jgi:hypothetical protein
MSAAALATTEEEEEEEEEWGRSGASCPTCNTVSFPMVSGTGRGCSLQLPAQASATTPASGTSVGSWTNASAHSALAEEAACAAGA